MVVIFLIKNKTTFQNSPDSAGDKPESKLAYSTETFEDLVNKDTDSDGILDWQEGLYGLDPNKKETTSGTPDSVTFSKLKAEQQGGVEIKNSEPQVVENLTETEKFSRELFGSIAAASQNGTLDETSIDQLGASLIEKIQNPPPRKVFLISDLKITDDDGVQAFRDYKNNLNNIIKKHPIDYTVMDVLQKFIIDENNVDMTALEKLDPIIEQTTKIINEMVEIRIPNALSGMHLNALNSLQRLVENLNDIKLFDKDIILAISGISQYQTNNTILESDLKSLGEAVNQKLSQ